jgi:hypothetical protein
VALAGLAEEGVRVVMLTGDNRTTAEAVAERLGIAEVIAEVLPEDKQRVVERLKAEGRHVAMAGDGVSDAPALAAAEVGVAMGTGTDVAIESAGVTLLGGDLTGIVRARRLSRAVMRNIRQNLFFAFAYNAAGVPVAAGGAVPVLRRPALACDRGRGDGAVLGQRGGQRAQAARGADRVTAPPVLLGVAMPGLAEAPARTAVSAATARAPRNRRPKPIDRPMDRPAEAAASPLLADKHYDAPSVFQPDALLREARRQKRLPAQLVPSICLLDPDGDLVAHLSEAGRCRPHRGWACYHTELVSFELPGVRDPIGAIGRAVGTPFAVLLAEQLFASGCRLLLSVTSSGGIAQDLPAAPHFVLVERALRDEGTSHHYLPPARFAETPDRALLDQAEAALPGTPLLRGRPGPPTRRSARPRRRSPPPARRAAWPSRWRPPRSTRSRPPAASW